jgi:large subunit ribosomal protein L6
MSRIGKKPIPIPKNVRTEMKGNFLTIAGPMGQLQWKIHPAVSVQAGNDQIVVSVNDAVKGSGSLHGLHRALIAEEIIRRKAGKTGAK